MNEQRHGASFSEKKEPLRTLFCGTPEFALPTLQAMIDSRYVPQLVLTQPDRPRGRGQRPAPSPVKKLALEADIPVHQPERFNSGENLRILEETGADLGIVVAYSAKIGNAALKLLPKGWLNLHPSLLPAYRGAAPIQWALIRGETRTGITTFFLNEGWDAGPICLQREIPIDSEHDYGRLAEICASEGADLVLESLRAVEAGTVSPTPQDDGLATFAPLLQPGDCRLNWEAPAIDIHNRVRGLSPKPGAFCHFRGKWVQIHKTHLPADEDRGSSVSAGEVSRADKYGICVGTGSGSIELVNLKPENRSVMAAADFVNGYRVQAGDRFE